MGKTRTPISILVLDPTLLNAPEILALTEKGHTVDFMDLSEWDLIVGSSCQLMTPAHLPYLPGAVKRSARERYGSRDAQ